jgi:lipopolysaccharide transport system permease protein
MVWRDLKARYRQMALGPLWIVLQPLVSMVLYTVVFGVIARLPSDGIPYTVFSYLGLLPWTLFAGAVGSGSGSLLGARDIISKVYFPRLLTPLSQIVSSLVDFGISFVILILMLLYYGLQPTWGVLLIPVYLLVATATGLGFGLLFSGVIVRYRDFGQVAGYLVRAWMYASPVVYSITTIPEEWRWVYRLNPMTGVVEGFRWALAGTGAPPDWTFLASLGIVAVLLVAGLYVFKRSERNIVDLL